jgi:hypothetical protein
MTDMDPEELFPPKRGGMVDTARQQQAAESAQLAALPDASQADSVGGYPAVRVRDEQPDLGIPRTFTLSSANPAAQLLPADPGRRSAIILAVDNDVYIGNSLGNVQNVSGGATGAGSVCYLPAGTPIPILNTAAWYVAITTSSGNSRVSVLISKDSDT